MNTPRRSLVRRLGAAGRLGVTAAPGALAAFATLTMLAGLLPVAAAWLMKMLLDSLVGGTGTLAGPGAGLVLAGVLGAALPHLTRYLQAHLEREVGLLAQDRLFAAVERFLGLARFENPRFLDRLRLAEQAGRTTVGRVLEGALTTAQAAITITGYLGALLLISPALATLVLGAGVPTMAAELALSRRRARMFWRIAPVERREIFYSDLLTSVEAATEVRLFGIGGFLRARMLSERRTANAAKRAVDGREAMVQTGLGLLAALVAGAGLLWAVTGAGSNALSIGDVTMFIAAIAGVQGGVSALTGSLAGVHQALLLFDHYIDVTTAGSDLRVPARPRPLAPLRAAIELRDVWFRYSDEHPWVLRGVDLRIPHGQSVALVGLNGAGKSTLVKLLCRFYDPTRGSITWDGADLREVDVAELRGRIGAVFQDYMHYDLTAAENIALGDLDALDDRRRIEAAAERAGVHPMLSALPYGYDTLLSRMFLMESEKDDPVTGVMLSGGQWQRLALARALLRERRDLMILDEPSAGLDAEAESEIHASLKRHRHGETSLLISHRLGAVRDADLIVVLRDGRIAEQGDHRALLAAGGEYARLFALQAAGYHGERAATLPCPQPAATP
ncbi:ABC transporter ATP-binding protein [Krasilnikovia sp. MM14-A1259]|uniref:ABC transporter ATP-binding protein n=1 Tax=Krasilnikovia sp. MM14-A1259 TaxID=3373539 RepID=UPI0038056CFB